jgi:hypothetical protein
MADELEAVRKVIKRYFISAADNVTQGQYDEESLEEHVSIAIMNIEREKDKFIAENQEYANDSDETDGEFAF